MFTHQALLTGLAAIIVIEMLPALFSPKKFNKAVRKFMDKEEYIRITSGFLFFISFLFLTADWRIEDKGWEVLVPIFGYLSLIKAIIWFWNPEFVKKQYKSRFKSESATATMALIAIIAAGALWYIGNYMV